MSWIVILPLLEFVTAHACLSSAGFMPCRGARDSRQRIKEKGPGLPEPLSAYAEVAS